MGKFHLGTLLAAIFVIGLWCAPAIAQDTTNGTDNADSAATTDGSDTGDTGENDDTGDNGDVPATGETAGTSAGAQGTPDTAAEMAKAEEEDEEWYEFLDFSGRFRFRQQYNYTEGGTANAIPGYGQDRYRMRYRLLLDFTGAFDEKRIEYGFQIGTGAAATSANNTFDGNFAPGGIGLRAAWARANFLEDMLHATVGAFPYPKTTFRSIMTWDSDISLTGIHLQVDPIKQKVDDGKGGKKIDMALYIHAMGLFVNEDYTVPNPTPPPATLPTKQDVFGLMGGAQFVAAGGMLTIDAKFWAFTHAKDAYANLGGNKLEALDFAVQFKTGPIAAFAQFLVNLAPNNNNLGFLVGVAFGASKKPGDFWVEAIYYYMETQVWPAAFSDADAGAIQMPGTSGVEVNWKWMLCNNVVLGMEINGSYVLGNTQAGDDHDIYTVFTFDVEFFFD